LLNISTNFTEQFLTNNQKNLRNHVFAKALKGNSRTSKIGLNVVLLVLFCKKCEKEVVIYGVNFGAVSNNDLDDLRKKIIEEGKLILFNPPPFEPFQCPDCFSQLIEKTK